MNQIVWDIQNDLENLHHARSQNTDAFARNEHQLFIESTEKQDVDQFNTIDIQMNVNRSIPIWKIMANLNINNYLLTSTHTSTSQNSSPISTPNPPPGPTPTPCAVCLKKGLIFQTYCIFQGAVFNELHILRVYCICFSTAVRYTCSMQIKAVSIQTKQEI